MVNFGRIASGVSDAGDAAATVADWSRRTRRGADVAAETAASASHSAERTTSSISFASPAQAGEQAADFQIMRRSGAQELGDQPVTPQVEPPLKATPLTEQNLQDFDAKTEAGLIPVYKPIQGDLPDVPEAPYTRGEIREFQSLSDPSYIKSPEAPIPAAAAGSEVRVEDLLATPDTRPLYKNDLTLREDPSFDPEIEKMPLENVEGRTKPEATFLRSEQESMGLDARGSTVSSEATIPDADLRYVVTQQDLANAPQKAADDLDSL